MLKWQTERSPDYPKLLDFESSPSSVIIRKDVRTVDVMSFDDTTIQMFECEMCFATIKEYIEYLQDGTVQIVETGSNDNGSFIKYSNGRVETTTTFETAENSGFWTLPHGVIETLPVYITSTSADVTVEYIGNSTSSWEISTELEDIRTVSIKSTGFWK